MKKWQTAVVAILPISFLFLAMNIMPKLESSIENKGAVKAIEYFIELENYGYQLDFGIKFGREETAYRITEQVLINQIDDTHKREYYNVEMISLDNSRESINIQYVTDRVDLEGFLVNHSTIPGWYEVDNSRIANLKFDVSTLLKESLANNLKTAELVNINEHLEAYRIYQADFQQENWFQDLGEREQKHLLNIHEFRAEPYYMDIVINRKTDQIESIRLENSAIGDYLSVVNGYVKFYIGSLESINLNYVISNIKASDRVVELPDYMPLKE